MVILVPLITLTNTADTHYGLWTDVKMDLNRVKHACPSEMELSEEL